MADVYVVRQLVDAHEHLQRAGESITQARLTAARMLDLRRPPQDFRKNPLDGELNGLVGTLIEHEEQINQAIKRMAALIPEPREEPNHVSE